MIKIYNPEVKERFLSTYDNEDSRLTVRYVFEKTFLVENVLDKDLANFNLDQIGKCIANSSPHNSQTARTTGRFISGYISWAIGEGLREGNNINPMKGVDSSWYDQFVDRKKIHYSLDEFIELLEDLPNAQDQAFLALLFEGVTLDELKEIHYKDINWTTNEITIRERNNEVIKIDDLRFMRFIENAYHATTYRTFKQEDARHTEKELIATDYLFKNIKSPRAREGVPVNTPIFYTRLINIKNEFEEVEYLTPNAVKQSGMLKAAVDLYKEYGKLEYEQFALIGDKYGASKLTSNGHTYYNTTLMKEYINPEKIKELYNIEVKI